MLWRAGAVRLPARDERDIRRKVPAVSVRPAGHPIVGRESEAEERGEESVRSQYRAGETFTVIANIDKGFMDGAVYFE